jgi:hypothetical protein
MEADTPVQGFAAPIVCSEFTLAAAETWVTNACRLPAGGGPTG